MDEYKLAPAVDGRAGLDAAADVGGQRVDILGANEGLQQDAAGRVRVRVREVLGQRGVVLRVVEVLVPDVAAQVEIKSKVGKRSSKAHFKCSGQGLSKCRTVVGRLWKGCGTAWNGCRKCGGTDVKRFLERGSTGVNMHRPASSHSSRLRRRVPRTDDPALVPSTSSSLTSTTAAAGLATLFKTLSLRMILE